MNQHEFARVYLVRYTFSIVMKNATYVLTGVLVLTLIIAPYLVATSNGTDGLIFGGFLFNPLDGNSYLAKMNQGWHGEWRFHLPYSAGTSPGAYIFLFYIALGHLARLLNIPLIQMFHIARILGALLFLFGAFWFVQVFVGVSKNRQTRAFILISLGSGLGWLLIFTGKLTSDFWVAEAYGFLTMFSSPHFSLGLAILLCQLSVLMKEDLKKNFVVLAGLSLLEAIIFPFGLVILMVILVLWKLVIWLKSREICLRGLLAVFLGGIPYVLYQYLAIHADPLLAEWDRQNITTSPPLWDLLISFSPAIVFALAGLLLYVREKDGVVSTGSLLVSVWFAAGILLAYSPLTLQRRLLSGFYIPLAGLSVMGIEWLENRWKSISRIIWPAFLVLSLMTNAVILGSVSSAIKNRSSEIYLTKGELDAFRWLARNMPAGAVVLAAPETGNRIPAFTPLRVIYGHPFETVHAEEMKDLIEKFFSGNLDEDELSELIKDHSRLLVFFGPREMKMGTPSQLDDYPVVYDEQGVRIYSVK